MMKKRRNRLSIFCSCISLAVVLFSVSGCASTVDPGFAEVASQLEPGGCYYRISDNSGLFTVIGRIFRSFERALHASAVSDSAEKDQILAAVSMLELAVRSSGLTECRWSGASSVRLPNALEPTYRNRSFFLLPGDLQGVVWRLPGTRNRPLFQELADLPSDTIAAGDFILDLTAAGEMIDKSTVGKEWLESYCRLLLGASPRQVLEWLSGEWGFAVFPSADPDSFEFVLTFPDRKKHLFDRIVLLYKNIPGVKAGENELIMPFFEKRGNIFCYYDSGRITVYSSESVKNHFLFSDKSLARQPDFKRLSYGMPREGLGIFYVAGEQAETGFFRIPVSGGNVEIDKSLFDRPQLTVVRREKNGLSVISQGEFDLQTSDIMNFALIPSLLLVSNYESLLRYLPRDAEKNGEKTQKTVKQQDAENEKKIAACTANMKKLAELLKLYAAKNKGEYPAEMDIAGIKKILPAGGEALKLLICPGSRDTAVANADLLDFSSCSYCYFGSWKKGSSKKLPLLIDRPGNHTNRFCVVFNDGSCETFRLDNCGSFKRIAGYLHTRFQYQEEEFRELIRRASLLDDLFNFR